MVVLTENLAINFTPDDMEELSNPTNKKRSVNSRLKTKIRLLVRGIKRKYEKVQKQSSKEVQK